MLLFEMVVVFYLETSEVLESVKLTNEQILNSNTSLSLLKSDIERLRLTCLGERAAHTELISVLSFNSDLLVADRKDDGSTARSKDNRTSVVYYKVIVEGCEWSIGKSNVTLSKLGAFVLLSLQNELQAN